MTAEDFDGCHRECRTKGDHTRIWGGCEFGVMPEPTVGMWKTYVDPADGMMSIGADEYNLQELADLIEPALRQASIRFEPNSQAFIARGGSVRLSGGETAKLARLAAHAIIHRNDENEPTATGEEEQFGVPDLLMTGAETGGPTP